MMFLVSLLVAVSAPQAQEKEVAKPAIQPYQVMESFTGKITKNRVRLRLKPNLDAPIIKELSKDDIIVATSLVDDYYSVLPEKGMKGYIFRTYVLDGKIVGTHVHLRLEPDTTSPILAILNEGDAITGTTCDANNKWLEVTLPESVRFYVAKEYVNRIGPPTLYGELLQKKEAAETDLKSIEKAFEEEIRKPVDQIRLQPLVTRLTVLIEKNKDFAAIQEKAEALVHKIQEGYFKKNILAPKLDTDMPISPKAIENNEEPIAPETIEKLTFDQLSFLDREEKSLKEAITTGKVANKEQFYAAQKNNATCLHGIVQIAPTPHKNAPGDFVLVNPKTRLPEYFIYSTEVDLKKLIGKEVDVLGSERPNNDFAYKAYFILSTK